MPSLLAKSTDTDVFKSISTNPQPPHSQVPTMTGALKSLASSPNLTDRRTRLLFSVIRMTSRDFGLE